MLGTLITWVFIAFVIYVVVSAGCMIFGIGWGLFHWLKNLKNIDFKEDITKYDKDGNLKFRVKKIKKVK